MDELTIALKKEKGDYYYGQIYNYITNEIKTGKLLVGEKLPSSRLLAENLQVSRSTVQSAYDQLVAEGYLEAKPQSGYFVCKIEELFQIQVDHDYEKQKPVEAQPQVTYDFSPNGIDMTSFPFKTWRSITKNVLSDDNYKLFSLGKPQGEWELRTTISRYLHGSRGVNCIPEQIIIGAGNDYLLMLLQKILGNKQQIVMESPTYKRAYHILNSLEYPVETVALDDQGMSVEALRASHGNIAYVMPSHQFPMGTIMPIGRRMELLNWANEENNRYLIEDDYDSEFRYKGKPIPALQAVDTMGKVIYIGTFSKSIAPAIRVSYMVLPLNLLQQYHEKAGFVASTVSRIDQTILNEFIKEGHFERHLNKMRKINKTKHDILYGLLKEFQGDFTVFGENAGLHVLLECRDGRTEEELISRAVSLDVKVYGMKENMVGTAQEKPRTIILLGYGALSEQQIREGIQRLKKAWDITYAEDTVSR